MLRVLRSHLKSLKWVLWITAASMVFYLGAYFDFDSIRTPEQGADQDWAAYVGEEKITTEALVRQVQSQENLYREQFQGQFEAFRRALRIPETALANLIDRTVILEEARRLELRVSPDEIRSAIHAIPAFRNELGFVGRERYAQILAANNRSVQFFEKELAEDLLIQKWKMIMLAPVIVSDEEVEEAYRDRAETVSFDYVSIPPGRWPAAAPSEAEAREAFETRPADWRPREGRTISWVLVELDSPASPGVTDADVRKFYDDNLESFRRTEQRRARHILIDPNVSGGEEAARNLARDLLERIRGGAGFAALAREHSADAASAAADGDLGWFGAGAMVPEFDKAVFAARAGELIGPVRTPFGYHVIELTDIRPAGTTPFEEVRETIRQQIAGPFRRQGLSERVQELLSAVSDPAQFGEIARAKGYTVHESGVLVPGGPMPLEGSVPGLQQAIFGTPPGGMGPPVNAERGAVVFQVTGTVPGEQITWEQARPAVLERLRQERARDAAARGARRELDAAGGTLKGIAGRLDLEVGSAGPVRRGDPLPGLPADRAIEETLFEVPEGGRPVVLAAADASVIVVGVTDRGRPTPEGLAEQREGIREELEQERSRAVLEAHIRRLRAARQIRTNDRLIELLSS